MSLAGVIAAAFLIVIGAAWAAFWSAGAAMTTETGVWNGATWAAMGVAALGLIPVACAVYLLVRALLQVRTIR